MKNVFDPQEFYKFASWLYEIKDQKDSEALYRAIVGRAYYSAFLAARDRAGLTNAGAGIHRAVIEYWETKKKISVSNRLKSLKARREKADYILHAHVSMGDAGEALRLCQCILDDLNHTNR